MTGFWATYFSTLFKGIRMTALKERFEIRRAVNSLRKADHILYQSLWEDVEQTHRVTHAINEEKRLMDALRKGAENTFSLIYNLETGELQFMGILSDSMKELEKFSEAAGNDPEIRKIVAGFHQSIWSSLKKLESEQRQEYRQIMLVINETEEGESGDDHELFMANIKLAWQSEKKQTLLAKFAARHETGRIKIDLMGLKHLPQLIEALRLELTRKRQGKDTRSKVLKELEGTIGAAKAQLEDLIKELFLIYKRSILLTLKVILDINNLRQYNNGWKGKNYIPRDLVVKKEEELDKLENSMAKHFHTIAQGFRILITRIQNGEKEARKAA